MKFHIKEQGGIQIEFVKAQRGRHNMTVEIGTDIKYPDIKCYMTAGNQFFFVISDMNARSRKMPTSIILDIGKVTGQWFVGTDQDKCSCLALFSRVILDKMKTLEITTRPV